MSRFPLRYRIGTALVAAQLALVGAGASGLGLDWLGPAARPLNTIAAASGANFGYGFFSPGIIAQLNAYFDVSFADGTERTVTLDEEMSREGSLRVGDIIDGFVNGEERYDDLKLQRALSASLAATMFGRFPEARKVVVRLERVVPVSMEEFRRGDRLKTEKIYRAAYVAPTPVRSPVGGHS